jgi:antitoxin (DNA-binding transcriptional repressor) of toxin-antitoxin stability system
MDVTVEQAQASLRELIDKSARGERVVIMQEDRAVAEIVPVVGTGPRPRFGSCAGMLQVIADDDEHLKDFAGFMP